MPRPLDVEMAIDRHKFCLLEKSHALRLFQRDRVDVAMEPFSAASG